MNADGIHITHCCARHGCKYGDDKTCPVSTGKKSQKYMCEFCDNDLREGGLDDAYAANALYDLAHSRGYAEANHLHKCGCDTPHKYGCTG